MLHCINEENEHTCSKVGVCRVVALSEEMAEMALSKRVASQNLYQFNNEYLYIISRSRTYIRALLLAHGLRLVSSSPASDARQALTTTSAVRSIVDLVETFWQWCCLFGTREVGLVCGLAGASADIGDGGAFQRTFPTPCAASVLGTFSAS